MQVRLCAKREPFGRQTDKPTDGGAQMVVSRAQLSARISRAPPVLKVLVVVPPALAKRAVSSVTTPPLKTVCSVPPLVR